MNTTLQKPIHGAPKPKDVPADMMDTPPRPFAYKVGDLVSYDNGCGLKARARIRGFANPPHGKDVGEVKILGEDGKVIGREQHTTPERFVYLEHWSAQGWRVSAWWFAVGPESISDAQGSAA